MKKPVTRTTHLARPKMEKGQTKELEEEELRLLRNRDFISSYPWQAINDMFDIARYHWALPYDQIYGHPSSEKSSFGSIGDGVATNLYDQFKDGLEDHDRLLAFDCAPQGYLFDLTHEDCHPGYARIKNRRQALISFPETMGQELRTLLKNLERMAVEMIESSFMANGPTHDPHYFKADTKETGPAHNMVIKFRNKMSSNLNVDIILGLASQSPWPKQAEEWKTRARISGWPSKEMVEELASDGFILVPVAHPRSSDPNSQWRISFSKTEKALFHSLTRNQRDVFMLTKQLCKQAFSGMKLLCTYHVKTAFLWMLESHPAASWKDSIIGSMCCALIEKLSLAFTKGVLPSYFIPSNNLIDHLPRGQANTCAVILSEIRKGPLTRLVTFVTHVAKMRKCGDQIKQGLESKDNMRQLFMAIRSYSDWVADEMRFRYATFADTVTYRVQIELLQKKSLLYGDAPLPNIETLILYKDVVFDRKTHQMLPKLNCASIFCALASQSRVKYSLDLANTKLYKATKNLFELSLASTEGLPVESQLVEYASFLIDAKQLEKAEEQLSKPCAPFDQYKYYINESLGGLVMDSSIFKIWLKFRMALLQKGPGENIIEEYKIAMGEESPILKQINESKKKGECSGSKEFAFERYMHDSMANHPMEMYGNHTCQPGGPNLEEYTSMLIDVIHGESHLTLLTHMQEENERVRSCQDGAQSRLKVERDPSM